MRRRRAPLILTARVISGNAPIHADFPASDRLRRIKDPLHQLKLSGNGLRSRVQPPPRPSFCVGLAKAGTHTIADVMGETVRSAHEPEAEELLALIPRARAGQVGQAQMQALFQSRRRRLRLDFESSHLLGTFVPHLVEIFPDSPFLLLVRDCRSWIDSMINDQLFVRSTASYPMWKVVYEQYLGGEPKTFPAQEAVLRELDLYPLSHYVAFWVREIQTVIDTVPPERLLVVQTENLAAQLPRVRRFLGAPSSSATLPHSYRASAKRDVLAQIDADHLQRMLAPAAPVAERVATREPAGATG